LGLAMASLIACGDAPRPTKGQKEWSDHFTTGGVKEVPIASGSKTSPYTIAGFREVFEALSAEVKYESDPYLAYSIDDVQVIPMDHNNNVTETTPYRLQVQI